MIDNQKKVTQEWQLKRTQEIESLSKTLIFGKEKSNIEFEYPRKEDFDCLPID